MDADRDGQAEAQHHATRTAAAQCYVDFLLGRVLPVRDPLTALLDSLDRATTAATAARPDAAQRLTATEAIR
jgi:hypothetical protein